jgi:predicted transcriptional regulator
VAFEINVVSNTPLTPLNDIEEIALIFLNQIGYLPKGYEPHTDVTSIKESVPYKLFVNCFLARMDKVWPVEELAAELKTTKATVYRHINKLKGFDIIEDVFIDVNGVRKKGYRIRYGDLSKAWNITEAHVEMAMKSYRQTVDHLQSLIAKKQTKRK